MTTIDGSVVPRFAPGVRLQFDQRRNAWVVLSPERVFLPDEPATAILRLIDGSHSLDAIVADLVRRFEAPADRISADAAALLRELSEKGVVTL
ncbi:MAG: pqqD [Rhodospirillales bacterium]|jgi:pyrroloquinoline quinone biosynthesis protein D|nr:pqqD [Rhodospirillales bacterium]